MIDLKTITGRPDQFGRLLKLVRQQEQLARFGRWTIQDQHTLARLVEQKVSRIAAGLGYRVWPTPRNSAFDLWIEGCRVEVKGSRWQQAGRYQAAVRNHQADLVIFDAVNGTDHYFIIPMSLVIPRRTIEITKYDVTAYSGQWAAFLETWNELHQAIETAPAGPVQLNFLELAHVPLSTNH